MRRKHFLAIAVLALLLASGRPGMAADAIRLGVSKIANCAPIAIAIAKGYFTDEGLEPKFTDFQAQAPVAVAVASGDLDFGDAAETAALYNLAADGRLHIIAGGATEAPSFHSLALVASNKAYAAGLRSPRDLPGHSFALTQMGSGLQYSLGRIAVKEGFDVKTVQLLPLQSNPNIASALSGGRADAAVFDSTNALPLIEKDEVKLIAWVGDLTGSIPAFLVFASSDMLDHHPDTVRRFMRAYRKALHDYYGAFTTAQGLRKNEPTAPATLAMIASWVDQPPASVALGLPYFDRDGRVDMAEIQKQIDWYRSFGAIKGKVLASTVVDARFAVELPETRTVEH